MKNKICFLIISLCIILSSRNIVAGYESTTKEEVLEHLGGINDAYLTERQEERARMEIVDDAFLTENQEEIERMQNVNDAATTWAEEQVERS
jgi:hypothetical protein